MSALCAPFLTSALIRLRQGKDSVPDTVMHLVIDVDPVADRLWSTMADVPTDAVHRNDNLTAANDVAMSEGCKRLKLPMFVALVEQLHMDQCLVFCRTNVDCNNLEAYLTALGGGSKFRAGRESGKENKFSCCVVRDLCGGWRVSRRLVVSVLGVHHGCCFVRWVASGPKKNGRGTCGRSATAKSGSSSAPTSRPAAWTSKACRTS